MTHVDPALDLFTSVLATDEAAIGRVRSRLDGRADAAGILDVAYRTLDTPIGRLLVAGTPAGLVRVAFPLEGHDRVLEGLARRISPRILLAPARLDPVARQLDEYFSGRRRRFELPMDLQMVTGFRRSVLDQLIRVEFGSTASYATIAAATVSPRAVRAVGTACATNPLPIVIPCHRVIRSDGGLGGYLGGTDIKRALLAIEAA